MKILNLTERPATQEQKELGVFDLSDQERELLIDALTFDECPTIQIQVNGPKSIYNRARRIVDLTRGKTFDKVMIDGPPYFMPQLQYNLDVVEDFSVVYPYYNKQGVFGGLVDFS